MFDLKVSTTGADFLISDYLIKISGPGGEATIPMDSSITKAFNQWYTLSYPVSQNSWKILSGDWNSIISDIRELRLIVEYINGSETVCIDNFRISDSPPAADFIADLVFIFPGDSVQFSDLSINAPTSWEWAFGDGEVRWDQSPLHYYSQPGLYDVKLTAFNQFGSETLTKDDYIQVAGVSDSILFEDDFDNSEIHPAWRLKNGTWQERDGTIIQTSNYYGGTIDAACYAMVGSHLWKNYRLQVDLKSSDNDKIGVVFNYQDAGNFYLFTWQREGTHRAIKRFVDGQWINIASDSVNYEINQWYQLDLVTRDGQIDLSIDSTLIFSVEDTTFMNGKAGLYCYGNQSSFWDNLIIENLDYISTTIQTDPRSVSIESFSLSQNYPNPFNPSTSIKFTLPEEENVRLVVYNSLGQTVQVLIDRELVSGNYEISFNAKMLPSGTYFYRISTGTNSQVRKMLLLK